MTGGVERRETSCRDLLHRSEQRGVIGEVSRARSPTEIVCAAKGLQFLPSDLAGLWDFTNICRNISRAWRTTDLFSRRGELWTFKRKRYFIRWINMSIFVASDI